MAQAQLPFFVAICCTTRKSELVEPVAEPVSESTVPIHMEDQVPNKVQTDSVQGELLRANEWLQDEVHGNGNAN